MIRETLLATFVVFSAILWGGAILLPEQLSHSWLFDEYHLLSQLAKSYSLQMDWHIASSAGSFMMYLPVKAGIILYLMVFPGKRRLSKDEILQLFGLFRINIIVSLIPFPFILWGLIYSEEYDEIMQPHVNFLGASCILLIYSAIIIYFIELPFLSSTVASSTSHSLDSAPPSSTGHSSPIHRMIVLDLIVFSVAACYSLFTPEFAMNFFHVASPSRASLFYQRAIGVGLLSILVGVYQMHKLSKSASGTSSVLQHLSREIHVIALCAALCLSTFSNLLAHLNALPLTEVHLFALIVIPLFIVPHVYLH